MADLVPALLAYAIPAALITMLPGPDTAMVLATAVNAGRRASAPRWAWGTGLLIWGAAAAAGLAAALRRGAVLYDVFRLACVAYLVVLAVQAVRVSRRRTSSPDPSAAPAPARSGWLASFGWGYRRALMTCLLNPKLGVFFVVFLPQFIPAGASVLARRRVRVWLDRVTAGAFLGFGLRLATETRP